MRRLLTGGLPAEARSRLVGCAYPQPGELHESRKPPWKRLRQALAAEVEVPRVITCIGIIATSRQLNCGCEWRTRSCGRPKGEAVWGCREPPAWWPATSRHMTRDDAPRAEQSGGGHEVTLRATELVRTSLAKHQTFVAVSTVQRPTRRATMERNLLHRLGIPRSTRSRRSHAAPPLAR